MNNEIKTENTLWRIRIWYVLILLVMVFFGVRLFYLQVIRYDHYRKVALQSQLKEYEIPAPRGIIEAHDKDTTLPLVLNETLYTLFVDPKYIENPDISAKKIEATIGGNVKDYVSAMKSSSRYAVLGKKLSKDSKIKIDKLAIKGVGTRETPNRTYPQGDLAAQVLGFVDDEGNGKYGIEQALQRDLKGTSGQLKAITDASGVPLVANTDNVITQPKAGKRVLLTIDLSLQRQLQDILKTGLDNAKSKSGSAIILDPKTGAVKAMANYPSYNPSEFYKVNDIQVFNNASVSSPIEVGSIMKPLTMAAALDQGVVKSDTTYFDPSRFVVDGKTITNVEEDGGAGIRDMKQLLNLSLNTGATWLLMQMGEGKINATARQKWYNYMVNHYYFGKETGIEQGYEAAGSIPDPIKGYGLNIQYANTSFGQGMSATMLQMAAALASVVNGGTYYKPYLVDATTESGGQQKRTNPIAINNHVVSGTVSAQVRDMMEYVVKGHYLHFNDAYRVGGKTGTPQIANPAGGYYNDKFNGTYMGYVGGDTPEYVIVVRVNEPQIRGYAGTGAAQPIFVSLVNMLINSQGVTPKRL